MQITSHSDPAAFLRQAQAYLERNEAATALLVGIAMRLAEVGATLQPYFAVAEGSGGIELAAMMTPPNRLVLWSEGAPSEAAVAALAEDFRGRVAPGVLGPPALAEAFLADWSRPGDWRLTIRERIYELTEVIPPPALPGGLRQAAAADLDLVTDWAWAFHHEALGIDDRAEAREIVERKVADGTLYLWDDGQPVTMAGHGRETRRSSTISLVYTPPEFRRRGYAMACVAALSQQRLDSGKAFCTLFTDLANATSNSIYQQIGYRPVCDFNAYDLVGAAQ